MQDGAAVGRIGRLLAEYGGVGQDRAAVGLIKDLESVVRSLGVQSAPREKHPHHPARHLVFQHGFYIETLTINELS